jgi:hypothetical protein
LGPCAPVQAAPGCANDVLRALDTLRTRAVPVTGLSPVIGDPGERESVAGNFGAVAKSRFFDILTPFGAVCTHRPLPGVPTMYFVHWTHGAHGRYLSQA